jgi:ActR/RegA family two-component response regulator
MKNRNLGRRENTHQAPLRLLLVDDEKGFVEVLAKRLAKRNIHTTQAFSGTDGIRLLRRSDFDVAVLDLKLDDMDGIEILKIFRKMAPECRSIMLTGHGCEIAAEDGMRFGASSYLTKPCDLEELVDTIVSVTTTKDNTHDTH